MNTRIRYFDNDGVLESSGMDGANNKVLRVRLNDNKFSVLDQNDEILAAGEAKTSTSAKIKAKESLKNFGVVFSDEKRQRKSSDPV